MEIWCELPNYNGIYLVSNLGKVKSVDQEVNCKGNKKRIHKGKMLKTFLNERGYVCVTLTKNHISKIKKVHRLVAETFLPNLNNMPQVNHIDCNKQNNCVENLEWCNNSYNMKQAYKNNLKMGRRKEGKICLI